MTKKILYSVLASAFLYSCGGNQKAEFTGKINSQEQKLFSDQKFNDSAAQAVVIAYDEFVSLFPEDSLAPDYIFKAGEVSLGLNQPEKSMDYFKKVYEQYPQFGKAPYSLFLQAYVLDNYLNKDKEAEDIYKSFIDKYPDHEMVKDATFSIQNLGKTDEELIKEFEARQAAEGI